MTTLSCDRIRERIADGDTDATLAEHARTCTECAPILAALDDVDAALEALPTIDAPDALVERTIARVREEQTAPVTVGAPSLLAAAFAMLTSAIGALVVAPVIAVRWLLGVGTERSKDAPIREEARGFRFGRAPTLAMSSLLLCLVGFMAYQRFGATVKTKTRGAETVVGGLPTASQGEPMGWWDNADRGRDEESDEEVANDRGPAAIAAITPTEAAPETRGLFEDDWQQQAEMPADQPADELTETNGTFLPAQQGPRGFDAREQTLVPAFETLDLEAQDLPSHDGAEAAHHARATTVDETQPVTGREGDVDGRFAEGLIARDDTAQAQLRSTIDLGGRTDDGIVYRAPMAGEIALPGYWDHAQDTSGLAFASSQSWWANTYVPGDARLRVLHTRLAASPGALPGSTLSALALAESTSPTVPAVAAPTDRAIAIGVHADTTAIEGPTRVRMEIALRAIDQAAGRRGALRIALVVDARGGLGAEETAHLRGLLASLSRSLSPRDRVILTAAGPGGGTLVPLGVLRHGQVEVALRHLADTSSITGEAIPTSLEDALSAGLEAVAVDDDGAGLTLLVTPNGSHDARVDQALHLGAVAGVPTTAVGIGVGASTASLDAIALAGEGRRRMVLSDDDATRAVREELSAASRLVARALRVRIRLADGVQLVDVVGSHALDADETRRTRESERAIDQSLARRLGIGQDRDDDDSGVRILVPSFYAGDSHTIVLDLLVSRPGPVADVDVRFKDLVRLGNGTASSALALEAGTAPRGPHELRVVASYVGHEVAGALDDAADAMERGDLATAHTRLSTVRALIDQARASVDGLSSVTTMNADALLLDRFLGAIDAASDPTLVAASLHYAAARRIVIPQLQASTP